MKVRQPHTWLPQKTHALKIHHAAHLERVSSVGLWHMDSLFSIKFQEFYSWENSGTMGNLGKPKMEATDVLASSHNSVSSSAHFHQLSKSCLQIFNPKVSMRGRSWNSMDFLKNGCSSLLPPHNGVTLDSVHRCEEGLGWSQQLSAFLIY
jgi:hypothetical protein